MEEETQPVTSLKCHEFIPQSVDDLAAWFAWQEAAVNVETFNDVLERLRLLHHVEKLQHNGIECVADLEA